MPGRVAIVTDSTAYLPDELITGHDVSVVPVQVVIGGVSRAEGTEVTPAEVARALREFRPVSTSRPAPEDFAAAYRLARDAGATAVVSAHLSAELSATYESALLAAKTAPLPVEVVDSRTIAMGLGYGVLAGVKAAEEGADVHAVAHAVSAAAARTVAYFYVDTLEYLRRGGRIGAAQAVIGSALSVKPLLHIVDGKVVQHSKVRTAGRALATLEELVVAEPGAAGGDVTVHHLDAAERAADLATRLRSRLPETEVRVIEVGAVVGAHVGPGMVAVIVA